MHEEERKDLSARLARRIQQAIVDAGGWLPFDRFMAMALYTPGLGYYANAGRKFGSLPTSGSDFVTAPELSPLFGRAVAAQVLQALEASQTDEIIEFGAGSGALAEQLLGALGSRVRRYTIVDLSGVLRERQQERLAAHAGVVQWADAWPEAIHGVVVGNEVLDAMPVQLLHFDGARWFERGVVIAVPPDPAPPGPPRGASRSWDGPAIDLSGFAWADRETELRPPVEDGHFTPGTVTEIHPQAEAFIASLAERLQRGAAFFIDYGFPEHEYYHPQRTCGTLMCHQAHRADPDPLADVGLKDITAHVNFTGVALAGQNAGLEVLGYTSQARFLMNCGLLNLLQGADAKTVAAAQKLLTEHEMGELFKVIGFAAGGDFAPLGFASGDRTHTL